MLFFTNNIYESLNRSLNAKYIDGGKTLYSFKNSIIDLLDLYNNNKIYQEKNKSVIKSLEHYVKQKIIFDLISNNDLKKIKDNYKIYMKENKFPINEGNYDSDIISNNEKKT